MRADLSVPLSFQAAMIASPFPGCVGFAVVTKDCASGFSLDPTEARILSPRAALKRREEFVLGRAAAHAALKQIGFSTPPPILQGPQREPLWPAGHVGSITHTDGIAACAVCSQDHAAGIGIDLEIIPDRFDQDLCLVVGARDERAWVGGDTLRMARLFSAKEAVFKAMFPLAGVFLDFMDAGLIWHDQGFRGRLMRPIGPYPQGFEFPVGSIVMDTLIFSYMSLPPR